MNKRVSVCLAIVFVCFGAIPALAQNAALVGTVRDSQQALIPGAMVTLQNLDTSVEFNSTTNGLGNYEFPTVRPGNYSVRVELSGFRRFVQNVVLAVNQRGRVDATLQVGDISAEVTVQETTTVVQTESSALGDVVHSRDLVNIPLNGRFFLDLALMTAGTVVPSTNTRTFLATPSGIGISGINASGTREDSTNYLFDGINLSDMVQNQITFQPNIESIQEFKVQTNAFSAEYGRNAGIIVNGISKQGTNSFHGSAFEYLRNEKLDAKNFFDPPDQPIPPFKQNQFGAAVGGPIVKNRTFFFFTYEGLRQRQELTMNSGVLSDTQRAQVTDPVVRKLLDLIPRANAFVAGGPRFVGPARAPSDFDEWSGDASDELTARDHLHAYYAIQRDRRSRAAVVGEAGSALRPRLLWLETRWVMIGGGS